MAAILSRGIWANTSIDAFYVSVNKSITGWDDGCRRFEKPMEIF